MRGSGVFESDKELMQHLIDGGKITYARTSIADAFDDEVVIFLDENACLTNTDGKAEHLKIEHYFYKKYVEQPKEIDFSEVPDYLSRGAVLRPKTVRDKVQTVSMRSGAWCWYHDDVWFDVVVMTNDLILTKWTVVKEPTN